MQPGYKTSNDSKSSGRAPISLQDILGYGGFNPGYRDASGTVERYGAKTIGRGGTAGANYGVSPREYGAFVAGAMFGAGYQKALGDMGKGGPESGFGAKGDEKDDYVTQHCPTCTCGTHKDGGYQSGGLEDKIDYSKGGPKPPATGKFYR